jgi:putative transposase
MRDLVILFIHLIATFARLLGPGGRRSVRAESLLVKQQLLILNCSRQRSPNLRSSDRIWSKYQFAIDTLCLSAPL